MGAKGPKRADVNSAPIEALTPLVEQTFRNLGPGIQTGFQGLLGGSAPGALTNQALGSGLQRFAQQNPALQAFQAAQGALTGQFLAQNPGQSVINAAQPIFQRNLSNVAATIREQGPRFAASSQRQVGLAGERALQDFNLFQQQVLEQGQQRQLAAAQALGGLGQGAAQIGLGALGQAGRLNLDQLLGQGQLNQQGILGALGLLFPGLLGAGVGPAVIEPGSQGLLPGLLGAAGTVGGAFIGGPGGAAAGGQVGNVIGKQAGQAF